MASHRPKALPWLALAGAALLWSGCGGGGGSSPPPAPPAPPLQIATPAAPVDGPAWRGFGSDVQHSALAGVATQDLNRIAWQVQVDLAPQYRGSGALLTHYGSPVVTSHNTVIVPVKTGAAGGFRFEARSGTNGGLVWWATSDYLLPAHNWIRSYNLALAADNRLYAPGAGGKLDPRGRRCCHRRARDRGFLRRRRVCRGARRLRRHGVHQHAAHRRPAGQRVLRLRRHRRQPGRPEQRRCPYRRRRQRQLGRRDRGRPGRRDRQGRDEQARRRSRPTGRRSTSRSTPPAVRRRVTCSRSTAPAS